MNGNATRFSIKTLSVQDPSSRQVSRPQNRQIASRPQLSRVVIGGVD